MDLHNNKNSKIESLTLKLRIYEIYNLYRIIPYNVNHLYLGAFDLVSFQYFVEYITSSEFSVHSKIQFLQITLSNTIIAVIIFERDAGYNLVSAFNEYNIFDESASITMAALAVSGKS